MMSLRLFALKQVKSEIKLRSTARACLFHSTGTYGQKIDSTSMTDADCPRAGDDVQRQICDVTFDNCEAAFRSKSTAEIARSLAVFKLCSWNFFVNNGFKLMDFGNSVIGKSAMSRLIKPTFYKQFVGGETEEEVLTTVEAMKNEGVRPLLALPMEELKGSTEEIARKQDNNLRCIVDGINLAKDLDSDYPMMQLKMTALLPIDVCERISEEVREPSRNPDAIMKLATYLEGKPDIQVFQNVSDKDELYLLRRGLAALNDATEHAHSKSVQVLVDAEYTHINPALNLVSLALMILYNKQTPLVSYTYQNYLKSTYKRLSADIHFTRSRGVCFGAKLVRGAYLESEKSRAQLMNYASPLHSSYEDTGNMYTKSVTLMLENISKEPGKHFAIVATHNEDSVKFALHKMKNLKLNPVDGSVVFGQVMGMCDHVSCSLGAAGYLVFKSIPFGPLDETIPYLYRRALENRSVLSGTQAERKLLWKTLKRRLSVN